MSEKERLFQATEFARLAGVTVRALHHYDRLGLLKPVRTRAGYRLYGERELARLQQIVTLKFIGFPLKEIRELLDDEPYIAASLLAQRRVIEEKRRQLDAAIEAISRAERAFSSTGEVDWDALRKIIEVVNMQNDWEWMKKYYSQEAREKISARAANWTPELQAQAEGDWATLIKDVEAALAEDPASDRAQQLAERWANLIASFTAGDASVSEGLNRLYADQENWPSNFQKPYSDEVGTFICRAMEIRKERTGS
jgi:DNA-binding transcriptional MerR regulator